MMYATNRARVHAYELVFSLFRFCISFKGLSLALRFSVYRRALSLRACKAVLSLYPLLLSASDSYLIFTQNECIDGAMDLNLLRA